jgi:hypothetical protein
MPLPAVKTQREFVMGTKHVGSDLVLSKGDRLLVRSASDMPLWRPSRHRRVAILFEGGRYTVTGRQRTAEGLWEYQLEPYPDVIHELPSATIEYGEAYVWERDEVSVAVARRERRSGLLHFLSPLLGFLPSSVKLNLQDHYGLDPRSMTQQSLAVEWALMLVSMTSSAIGRLVLGRAHTLVLILFVLLLIDLIVRRHATSLDSMEQFGFFEWLVRGRISPKRISPPVDRLGRIRDRDET